MVLIRRSLVMMGYLARLGTKNTYKAKFEALSAALDDAPSVDAEPVRHGRWIEVPWIYYGAKQYMCDQCKDDEFWKKKELYVMYPRCPNCGAMMDGGDA